MNRHQKKLFRFALFVSILFCSAEIRAQQGTGGTTGLFSDAGVGARALALGNAYVAVADEPTVIFWNAAGLDFLEKTSASFHYATLIVDGQYSFVGLAYPTLSIGGFGFGWLRVGTGDITERDPRGLAGATSSFSSNQVLFSYGKRVRTGLSLGLSLKVETLNTIGNLSDSGIGLDFGLMYRPRFDEGVLRDLSIGANIQNLIQPKTRLVDRSDTVPRNFKFGVAKPFKFGDEQTSAFTLLVDFNKSQNAAGRLSFGAEYAFNQQAMLRLGANDGRLSFGAGAAVGGFRLDYSFGKLFEATDFSGTHRFTLTIDFGKTRTERIEMARLQREREIQVSIDNQLWFESETQFNTLMEEGRRQYYNGDYLGAYADFNSAAEVAENMVEIALRFRGENRDDPEANLRVETANAAVLEAQNMLKLANTKNDSLTRAQIRDIVRQETRSAREQELRDFILSKRQKGDAFFKKGRFSLAIREWQDALDRLTQGEDGGMPAWAPDVIAGLRKSIQSAQKELEGSLDEAIRRADQLARRGNYVQALNVLNDLIVKGSLSQDELEKVNEKTRLYQAELTFVQNFDEGVRQYENKNWSAAMAAFQRALQARPNDARARRYYEDAEARAKARPEEMPPNLRVKYVRGRELYRQGKYEEALQVWEEIRKVQPYNKIILDAIDRARDRLKEQGRR